MKLELNKVYRDTSGREWKIICKEQKICFYGITKNQNILEIFWPGGEGSRGAGYDLIELVGDDFTKKIKGLIIEI